MEQIRLENEQQMQNTGEGRRLCYFHLSAE